MDPSYLLQTVGGEYNKCKQWNLSKLAKQNQNHLQLLRGFPKLEESYQDPRVGSFFILWPSKPKGTLYQSPWVPEPCDENIGPLSLLALVQRLHRPPWSLD